MQSFPPNPFVAQHCVTAALSARWNRFMYMFDCCTVFYVYVF